jgi:hypothetical protein
MPTEEVFGLSAATFERECRERRKGLSENNLGLCHAAGYDEYNTIILPPRGANEKLPPELYDFYEGEDLKPNFRGD